MKRRYAVSSVPGENRNIIFANVWQEGQAPVAESMTFTYADSAEELLAELKRAFAVAESKLLPH